MKAVISGTQSPSSAVRRGSRKVMVDGSGGREAGEARALSSAPVAKPLFCTGPGIGGARRRL